MSGTQSILAGKRVLVVEDEMLVAMLIEGLLEDVGCTIVGPCGSVTKALFAARNEELDLAILDVNLAGEKVYPVADVLTGRGIPFLFVSGYGEGAIPADRSDWKVCAKPFKPSELVAMLSALLDKVSS